MNRTTALIIALAILLAHTLALHKDGMGDIAAPFDVAFVAYRVARNFVHAGSFAWDPAHGGMESYPSLLWIWIAACAERVYMSVAWVCQMIGLASSLACVVILARFSPNRLAGVIAPLLFVCSGSVASAALSGLETATVGLLLTFSFLAYERGWRTALAIGLSLALLARPEALVFILTLIAIDIARRVWPSRRATGSRPNFALAFALPLVVWATVAISRHAAQGSPFSNWEHLLLHPRPKVWREGLLYLRDFTVATGGPALFIFPLWYLVRGVLSGVGARACALTLVWLAQEAATGGGPLPFFESCTPILAILFVAVQEAMQIALDSQRRGLPQLTWALFLLGLASSTLVSKFPSDFGLLPLEAPHRAWMRRSTPPRFGFEDSMGRVGLAEELRSTERLREIGIFMREHLEPSHSVLTPWPGAIGYLSRLSVIDALGRAGPTPGNERTRAWSGRSRTDVLDVLSQRPDYIVPTITFGDEAPSAQSIAAAWAKSLDIHPEVAHRSLAIRAELGAYELITVPIVGPYSRPGVFPRNRFYLMRRSDLGLAPELAIELTGREFSVQVAHKAHEQLADLRVLLIDRAGERWSLRPTGEFVRGEGVLARTMLLLHPTGERTIELMRARIPDELDAVELRAVLRNPGASTEALFSTACPEVVLRVE